MEPRICKYCNQQFQPLYKSDVHCNETCKSNARVKAKLDKWANGMCSCDRPKTKSKRAVDVYRVTEY